MSSCFYLDTSALIKRYVAEPRSYLVDEIFEMAYRGKAIITFSYWNIGEATVVFDEYRKIGVKLKPSATLCRMLKEIKMLSRMRATILVNVTPKILKELVHIVLKHHICLADAL